jgi:hypothetical protein
MRMESRSRSECLTSSEREDTIVKRPSLVLLLALLAVFVSQSSAEERPKETVAQLEKAFADYCGAHLVFDAKDLPEGTYHDFMPPLNDEGRLRAARIALAEIRKLPPRYLDKMGLKSIGIFAACVSRQGDGFRPFDDQLKGYRYFGIYNGKNALVAAYYSDAQLHGTLHHEVFHHVDSTRRGESKFTAEFIRDDRFHAALSGTARYPALRLSEADISDLRKLGKGRVLEKAVGPYCEKNVGEDKAETARYLMDALPDALVQMATRPELSGSQRLLHVLNKYKQAVPDGPGVEWFLSVALARPLPVVATPILSPASLSTTTIPKLGGRR